MKVRHSYFNATYAVAHTIGFGKGGNDIQTKLLHSVFTFVMYIFTVKE